MRAGKKPAPPCERTASGADSTGARRAQTSNQHEQSPVGLRLIGQYHDEGKNHYVLQENRRRQDEE